MIILTCTCCFLIGALFCLSLYENSKFASYGSIIGVFLIIFLGESVDSSIREDFKDKFTTGQYKVIEKQTIVGEDTLYSNVIIDTTTNKEAE